MKAPPFSYYAPRTVDEAIGLLGSLENARPLGGGQSLMPMLNLRLTNPQHLIDLGHIQNLAAIEEHESCLAIGAMMTQRAIERSAMVARWCPLLAEAVLHIGHQQTRNRGTIGGSLCHLDPGAELPVVAAALEALLVIQGTSGTRHVPFAEFPCGYLTSILEADEILVRIDLPKAPPRTGTAFVEFNRRPADFAVVSVAVQIGVDATDKVASAAIAIGGVSHAPIRLVTAEAKLMGRAPTPHLIQNAAQCVTMLDCDGDDLYPANFRREISEVLVARALAQACMRIKDVEQ